MAMKPWAKVRLTKTRRRVIRQTTNRWAMVERTNDEAATKPNRGRMTRFADWIDRWPPIRLLRVFEIFAILTAIALFWFELEARSIDREARAIDRAVRIATLYSQIGELGAVDHPAGYAALRPSVLALAEEQVSLAGLYLKNANLSWADLSGLDLAGADLAQTDLTGANLSGADLSAAVLTGADLTDADLTRSNLRAADLTLAFLNRANLSGAELVAANLSSAFLRDANLRGANLLAANLTGANLGSARLLRARNVEQTQLDASCAIRSPPRSLPLGFEWNGGPCPEGTWSSR